jgi:chromosome segregation ATPase
LTNNKKNIIITLTISTKQELIMELSKEIRERIFTAADALYAQGDRSTFPTVDAVRKMARVNMNDASAGMKEWRRAQTAQAAPVAVQVPEAVQQANGAALVALWQEAQELANESLRAAQAGWDAERVEAETLNKQIGDAYEAQAGELREAQARIVELETSVRQATEQAAAHQKQIEEAHTTIAEMRQQVAIAAARADELRKELDHAHQNADQARAERDKAQEQVAATANQLDQVRGELAKQLDQVRNELTKAQAKADADREMYQEQRKAAAAEAHRQAERLTSIQNERDQARKEASAAREGAATLRGRLEALESIAQEKAKGGSTKKT